MWWLVPIGIGLYAWLRPQKALARGPAAGLVPHGSLNSPFGPRGAEGVHLGIDVGSSFGAEVRAVRDGIVVDKSPDGKRAGYGNTIIIEHPDKALSLYAHLDRFGPGISEGMPIAAGTVVGFVGKTQLPKTSPMQEHLHFEILTGKIMWDGRVVANTKEPTRVDPVVWMKKYKRPLADA